LYNGDVFGQDQSGNDREVTAMGTSAAVMILTNLIAWPSILEGIRKQLSLRLERAHIRRATEFLAQLEYVVSFCSQLMADIKSLADS